MQLYEQELQEQAELRAYHTKELDKILSDDYEVLRQYLRELKANYENKARIYNETYKRDKASLESQYNNTLQFNKKIIRPYSWKFSLLMY